MKKEGYSEGCIRGLSSDLLRLATFNFIKVKGVGLWNHHKEFQGYATITQKNGCVKKIQ